MSVKWKVRNYPIIMFVISCYLEKTHAGCVRHYITDMLVVVLLWNRKRICPKRTDIKEEARSQGKTGNRWMKKIKAALGGENISFSSFTKCVSVYCMQIMYTMYNKTANGGTIKRFRRCILYFTYFNPERSCGQQQPHMCYDHLKLDSSNHIMYSDNTPLMCLTSIYSSRMREQGAWSISCCSNLVQASWCQCIISLWCDNYYSHPEVIL
jgi:hypothetical protein